MATQPNIPSADNQEKNTQQHNRSGFWNRMKSIPADRQAWLWLLIGFLLIPFSLVQTVIPLAAWLAPIFMLRLPALRSGHGSRCRSSLLPMQVPLS